MKVIRACAWFVYYLSVAIGIFLGMSGNNVAAVSYAFAALAWLPIAINYGDSSGKGEA